MSGFDGLPVRELAGGLTLIEASTLGARLRGLGGMDALPERQGLRIRAGSVHTFTVRFALDLIWLDRNERVLRVDRRVPRWRIRACRGARHVLEVSAGQADAFVTALSAPSAEAPGT